MSKKHFEFMARQCRSVKNKRDREVLINAYIDLALEFGARFDVQRFRAACEPEGATLRVKSNPHDFGNYLEVACYFDTDNEEAVQYAFDCEGEAYQLLIDNYWAWCDVCLIGRYKGLEAYDCLGACSYLSREDFVTPGGYYDDMKNVVLGELQEKLDEILDSIEEAEYKDRT